MLSCHLLTWCLSRSYLINKSTINLSCILNWMPWTLTEEVHLYRSNKAWIDSCQVKFSSFFARKYQVSCRENVGVNQESLGPFFRALAPLHFLSSRLYYSKVVTSTLIANMNITFCFSHYSCWQTQKQISRGLQISCRSCQLSKNMFHVWKRRWSTLKTFMRWALDGKWSKIFYFLYM